MKSHTQLNTLGLLCPQPIIETAKQIQKMKKGQMLEILSDDWGMKTDLLAWCVSTKNLFMGMKEEKNLIRFRVRKQF
ncbi:MAG: sulfurtransferase TusA family protein [Chlamydiae bacterium]|nr:sulfurtransferase TusA family protein [Chlamydiota bacterium]MBI3265886.1 sulfurtransferase TusA family protein [Chlamydiota bacterium]